MVLNEADTNRKYSYIMHRSMLAPNINQLLEEFRNFGSITANIAQILII